MGQAARLPLLLCKNTQKKFSFKFVQISPERIHPDPVVLNKHQGTVDLRLGHFAPDLLLADGRIRIAPYGAQDVPHVSAHEVGCRHTQTQLVVPANP